MDSHLSAVNLKIQWADKRISELMGAFAAFREGDPYASSVERHPQTRQPIYRLSKCTPIPPEISLIAGDVFQNLRSALDYLACGLVRANGKEPTPKTEFPVLEGIPTTAKQKTRFDVKVEGMRQEAKDAILALKPYKGGDDNLWRLHKLNIIDKHQLLITGWATISAIDGIPDIGDKWVDEKWVGIPDIPFPLKQGDQLFVDAPDAEMNKNKKFFLEVAINEPAVAIGYPLALAMRRSLHCVRKVVSSLGLFFL